MKLPSLKTWALVLQKGSRFSARLAFVLKVVNLPRASGSLDDTPSSSAMKGSRRGTPERLLRPKQRQWNDKRARQKLSGH